jgi:hypothetical protein
MSFVLYRKCIILGYMFANDETSLLMMCRVGIDLCGVEKRGVWSELTSLPHSRALASFLLSRAPLSLFDII